MSYDKETAGCMKASGYHAKKVSGAEK